MSDESNALAFERLGEPPGVEVIDRIEQQRYSIYTPEAVSPREIGTDPFHFPVERAVEFETTEFSLASVVCAYVRDADGGMVAEVDNLEKVSLPDDAYSLELTTQIKTYVDFEANFTVAADKGSTTVSFDEEVTVRLGVRSRHEHPAGTVTTTADPRDLMAAIETFGSALKTTDPERSYPTLRGHPPAVGLGERLSIPEGLEPPETGITIELPLDLETLYVAAPLTYYLGATLESGTTPKIVTDRGFEYPLAGPEGFQTTVANTLKQLFFLDCITRTEGLYQLPLAERERIEQHVHVDFGALYEQPLAEQLETYLDVPFAAVKDQLPDWPLSTHVAPVPETVEQLPFVVDDLAEIHVTSPTTPATQTAKAVAASSLARDDVFTRSAGQESATGQETFVQPEATDAVQQAWIGDDIPIGASKLTADAFWNRLDREITDGDIEISIVVNDDRMDDERNLVDRVYGDRENLPFDVRVHRDTTVAELRELLGHQRGFLHYIGHTEHNGFVCSDGKLDAAGIDEIGIESFLLNACKSYNQGLALVEAGAIGGIVTLTDIINEEGVAIGESVARLLNAGFPLRGSLTLARDKSIQGGQYIVVGDGGMSLAQAEGRTPNIIHIEDARDDEIVISIDTFATEDAGIGTLYKPFLKDVDNYHLASGRIGPFILSSQEMDKFLAMEDFPVKLDGDVHWSSSMMVGDLR